MDNVKKTVIIEFNGFAGCGKTTVAGELINVLKAQDYRIADWNTVMLGREEKEGNWKKEFLKCLHKISLQQMILCLRLATSVRPFRMESLRQIPGLLLIIARYKELLSSSVEEGYDYIVVDQGFVQGLVSVIHIGNIKNTRIIEKIIDNKVITNYNIKVINCVLDKKETLARIRNRNKNGSRMDRFTDNEQLLRALDSQKNLFETLRGSVERYKDKDVLWMNMKDTPEKNAHYLCEMLQIIR